MVRTDRKIRDLKLSDLALATEGTIMESTDTTTSGFRRARAHLVNNENPRDTIQFEELYAAFYDTAIAEGSEDRHAWAWLSVKTLWAHLVQHNLDHGIDHVWAERTTVKNMLGLWLNKQMPTTVFAALHEADRS